MSLPTQQRILKTALPGPRSIELQATRNQALSNGLGQTLPIFVEEAGGAIIVDVDGNHIIDMTTATRIALDPLDLAGIDDLLTPDEKAVRGSVRQMCEERILPYVADWFEQGGLPDARGLTKELGSLGVLGMASVAADLSSHLDAKVRD